ncbi:right-handed parallel beta-helix repeat-containing protein [Actinocorallia longicatena]|uniref:Right handed beta helix domain-containing protein n=1 Tax=Actinocorallia longicatena TaxID=111803 RepID=A0ABP6QPA5_9ACTN
MTIDLKERTLWIGIGIGVVITTLIALALRGGGSEEPGAQKPAGVQITDSPAPVGAPELDEPSPDPAVSDAPTAATSPSQIEAAPGGDVKCPDPTVTVSSAEELEEALGGVKPGDVISLEDGTYEGEFIARTPGTKEAPIFLCGGTGAVIDGGGVKKGYALHLDGASFWRVVGFTVQNSQKGVMGDGIQNSIIQGLSVHDIGDEAIHLRNYSSDNLVIGNTVSRTGQRREKFGEGIYIGNAESNWKAEFSRTNGKPDNSDRNVIKNNVISETTAESIDIKEGTTGGKIIGNRFDGSKLGGDKHNDSWLDIKGNKWIIEGNTGVNSFGDGFQTHQILDGWGTGNIFRNNTLDLKGGSGWGFHFAPINGNTVSCDNKVSGAAKGLTNSKCS